MTPDGGDVDSGGQVDGGSSMDSGGTPTDAPTGTPTDARGGETARDGSGPTWTPLPPLAGGARQETGVAALDGKIYVVGGFGLTANVTSVVEAYDPATRSWASVASLPRVLHHANTAAVNGKIYVVGALADASFRAINDVYVYDPGANAWSSRAPLPAGQERGASAVGVVGTRIYVAGGQRGTTSVADFSYYDTATDQHLSLPPMAQPTDHLVGGALDGIFYAIGGRTGGITGLIGKVLAFDTSAATAGTWSERAPMITPRGGAAAAVVRDRIAVAGGEGNPATSSGVFSQVEVYVPATNSWYALPDMQTPRHGTGGAAIGNTFYVPGGASRQAFGAVATVESIDL